ncbi:MAG: M23 family metallopeptidase [Verrucomicrobia bacterium]|nr:M23 family metallopeptidase [Verrucomicrobiota bacterium]
MRFHSFTQQPAVYRGEDEWGRGAFGASRDDHPHRGVDIAVASGDAIFAPFDGRIVRNAIPYDDDDRFSGILLQGYAAFSGYEMKIFYMQCTMPFGHVRAGELIGQAQNIALRYPGITNHIHVELWNNGNVVDPTPFLPSTEESF